MPGFPDFSHECNWANKEFIIWELKTGSGSSRRQGEEAQRKDQRAGLDRRREKLKDRGDEQPWEDDRLHDAHM